MKNENEKWELQQKHLDAVVGTIKQLNCSKNMNHGEFMIILGDVGKENDEGFEKLVYTPYLYNKDDKDGKFEKQDW